jgi:putative MATE family efflux protein
LIIPVVIEQALALTVGMVDAMMVSAASEAAMAGVSLTDTIAILLINIFSSFASGGAILIGQLYGAGDTAKTRRASSQLVYVAFFLSVLITAVCLALNKQILALVYGKIDVSVMFSASSYFYVTALSYPFIALFNSSAALLRITGNTRSPMLISLAMNALNIAGNALFIYGLHWGAFGAGLSTTIARTLAGLTMLFMLRDKKLSICVRSYKFWKLDWFVIKRLLHFGIPSGLENSIFQLGKIALSGLVSTLGTAAIAANSVINNIGGLQVLPGQAMSSVMMTVISQCVGAGEIGQAKRYFKRLMCMTYAGMLVFAVGMYLLRAQLLGLYNISEETFALASKIMLIHSFGAGLLWTISFLPSTAVRSAGDVVYPMVIAIVSMMLWRVGIGYLLVYTTNLGIYGVYIGILVDWAFRGATYMRRYMKGRWTRIALE